MVGQAFDICMTAFEAAVEWTTSLFDAMDASGYLIAVFILILIIGMLLIPMRGGSIVGGAIGDYVKGGLKAYDRSTAARGAAQRDKARTNALEKDRAKIQLNYEVRKRWGR